MYFFFCMSYFCFKLNIYRRDVEVKTLYHEMRDNLFSSLVEEFLSKKLPKLP